MYISTGILLYVNSVYLARKQEAEIKVRKPEQT